MKNKYFLFGKTLIVGLLLIFVTGCDQDDDEAQTNALQVGETVVELSDGNIKYYGKYSETSYNFDLDFVSSGIVLSTDEDDNPIYTGTGTRVYFEVYSESNSELLDGDYTFLNDGNSSEWTFGICSYYLNYNSEDETSYYIYNGTITVEKNGDEYIIMFSGTDDDENQITLYYKGTLHYYDRSDLS